MKKNPQITVNDQFEFELNENDLVELDILHLKKNKKHVLHNNVSHTISVVKNNFRLKTYEINIDSELYKVVIKSNLDTRIKKMGFSLGNASLSKKLKAPMPGFILEIAVKQGQQVKKGTSVIILEAMKMENTLIAPMDGRIKSIHVKKGESVEKETLLIEME